MFDRAQAQGFRSLAAERNLTQVARWHERINCYGFIPKWNKETAITPPIVLLSARIRTVVRLVCRIQASVNRIILCKIRQGEVRRRLVDL
jgi:hypothetical protein